MVDLLLAKPNLPEGWIDCSVGEPHLVREVLNKYFELDLVEVRMLNQLPKVKRLHEYPPPTGYQPLVEFLQNKHGAPVIITNGAKQALGACFYAFKKMGKTSIGMRNPYWALIPPLVRMHDLHCEVTEPKYKADALLLLAPNNPDGFTPPSDLMKDMSSLAKGNIPLVHDAAYYTHVYLPPSYDLVSVGDAQIYSISKMLGLSGLRLGYVVCPNPEFYRYIQEYMEAMTVGVSAIPQIYLEQLMKDMADCPTVTQAFELEARGALHNSRKIMSQLDSEILEVSNDCTTPGMFGWYKVGPKCDFAKARINAIDGALFGVPGMVRMNLALHSVQIEEIAYRLHDAAKGG